jgi:methyl-accepting chemotaxis protein
VAELGRAVAAFRSAAGGVGSSAERTAQEAKGIEEAAGGMRGMVEAFASSGDEALRAEAAFRALSDSARQGEESAGRALAAAREIDEAGSRVGGIALIIADVADKSNLLAMNASIEAAHGGAAGKGFAVVAREMKRLAESTAKSARQIEAEVKSVSDLNRRTAGMVESLGRVFQELSSGIEATGNALAAIAGSSKRNADQARGDLELIERLRAFADEILRSAAAARDAVAAMDGAVERLSSSQARSGEVNASLAEGVRSIVSVFTELDGSLGTALDEVADLEERVASYKLG